VLVFSAYAGEHVLRMLAVWLSDPDRNLAQPYLRLTALTNGEAPKDDRFRCWPGSVQSDYLQLDKKTADKTTVQEWK
jgi:hypothetical protein